MVLNGSNIIFVIFYCKKKSNTNIIDSKKTINIDTAYVISYYLLPMMFL